MLILTRKIGESIVIDDRVVVTLLEQRGNQIRVGIKAPKEVKIFRHEIYEQILEANKKAASTDNQTLNDALGDFIDKSSAAKPGTVSAGSVKMKDPEVIIKKKSPKND